MKQKFAFTRGAEAAFKPGFRSYFQDRDLGVKQATGGRFTAEVHRACAPCPKEGSGVHWHSVDFQFNYVLKGWIRVWIDGRTQEGSRCGSRDLGPVEALATLAAG